ncbi:AraC family transcriptional regulator [Bacillus spongiae]|uniref:AraC family transcriptional regulator n=1 Tax=Bacillus spongiae TaxID=2683610 RepID=A0ABU8HCV2_9BACI
MKEIATLHVPPSERLRKFIDCYWIWESNDEHHLTKLPRVLPNLNMEMIFYYYSPLICIDHKRVSSKLPTAHIAGIQKTHLDLYATGKIGIISVRFLPGTFHYFCNEVISNFTDNICSITDVWGDLGNELQDKIIEAETIKQRIDILEHYLLLLLERYYYHTANHKIQAYAVHKLMNSSRVRSIQTICNEVNISQRQLQRIFNESIGVNPKFFQKISTFVNASKKICLNKEIKYIDIVQESGYYDQAHFIKVFKQFSGINPLAILSSDFMSHFYNTKISSSSKM